MKTIERITSKCGAQIIQIIQYEDGAYAIKRLSRRYDSEEEREYVIPELPNPSGRFGDLSIAVQEARSLFGQG